MQTNLMGTTILEKKLSIFLMGLILMACTDTSIDGYTPRSQDEAGIIDILKQYQNSRNTFDLERYFACLYPTGKFAFMGSHILSKSSLEERLPRFWNRLKRDDATVYPIARESITGNYFRSWAFHDTSISINGDTATVTVVCRSSWICSQIHYLTLKKENAEWMISKTAWEHF